MADAAEMEDMRPVYFVSLTPIDQTVSRVYVRVLLIFHHAIRNNYEKKHAEKDLRQGLTAALHRWPFLAGVVGTGSASEDVFRVKYRVPYDALDCNFRVSDLRDTVWAWEDLTRRGVPPTWCLKPCLNDCPDEPSKLGPQYPVMRMDVTHMFNATVVGFAFHRSVIDGPSIKQFLKVFAEGCGHKAGQMSPAPAIEPIPSRNQDLFFLRPKSFSLADSHKSDDNIWGPHGPYDLVENCEEYDLGHGLGQPPADCSTVILALKHSVVVRLKQQVMRFLQTIGSHHWVSTIDCLCALIWIGVMRVRAHRLPKNTTVKFATAVDARRRLSQPRPTYFGNLIVAAVAKTTIGELIGEQEHRRLAGIATRMEQKPYKGFHDILGVHNDIDLASIARAALLIREQIERVDDDYVHQRMVLGSQCATQIRQANAYARAIDGARTGVDFSSWKDWLYDESIGADLSFKVRGLAPFPIAVRHPASLNEGSCILLPRPSQKNPPISGGTHTWEVSLCLRDSEMTHLRFPTELGGWAWRVYDQDCKSMPNFKPMQVDAQKDGPRHDPISANEAFEDEKIFVSSDEDHGPPGSPASENDDGRMSEDEDLYDYSHAPRTTRFDIPHDEDIYGVSDDEV